MITKLVPILMALPAITLAACTGIEPESREIALMTHDSFDVSEEVIAAFEETEGVTVAILPSGDAGTALNQAILAREDPLADVFYGVDNTFMGRALSEDLFVPYDSPLLDQIPDELELDGTKRLLPADFGDVCLNYDRDYFSTNALSLPESLADLNDPAYSGLLVVENPATSSPGLAFLLATVAEFGVTGDYTYLDFWRDLRANDVLVTNDWNDAYYGQFSVAGDGNRPLVVSYATSPPAELIFADPPVDSPPSGSITAPGTCFRQIEYVGILRGARDEELARKLVDFLLSRQFQEDLPLRMFVFPANENAALPTEFTQWVTTPDEVADLSPAEIDANRDEWIEAWTEVVLR